MVLESSAKATNDNDNNNGNITIESNTASKTILASTDSAQSSPPPSKKIRLNEENNAEDDADGINQYAGWCIPNSNNNNNNNDNNSVIERVEWDEETLTPQLFFEKYVSQRRPVVLIPPKQHKSSARKNNNNNKEFPYMNKWTPQYLKEKAGKTKVIVEQREHQDGTSSSSALPSKRTFGQGKTTKMTFASFINTIQNTNHNNESDVYLTTQDLTYDEEGRPSILSSPCAELSQSSSSPATTTTPDFPLLPSILGNLIPMTINLWWGSSTKGTSSGLHHDYHDNLYHLIKGKKTFVLLSPDNATKLCTVGKIVKVYPNGRICYCNDNVDNGSNGMVTVYADGSNADARRAMELEQKRVDIEEKLARAEKEGDERGIQEAEEELEEIMDQMIDCENDVGDDEGEVMDFDENDEEGEFDNKKNENDDETKKEKPTEENDKDITNDKKEKKNSNNENKNNPSSETTPKKNNKEEEKDSPQPQPKRKTPSNFSKIGTTTNWDNDTNGALLSKKYPQLKSLQKISVTINQGEALYMPCGWFHEVFSSNGNDDDSSTTGKSSDKSHQKEKEEEEKIKGHMALNWWVHPPDALDSYENPYSHGFWKWEFQQRKEAQPKM